MKFNSQNILKITFRAFVVFALIWMFHPVSASANTCALALTQNRNLSATSGLWTGAGCTTIPGAGDTVSITGAFSLTVDQNWTVGNYGAPVLGYVYGVNNTTPATGCSSTCTATVSGGTTTLLGPAAAINCSQAGGAATISLKTRGTYAAGSVTPTVAVSGTGCTGGTYSLNFEPGNGTAALTYAGNTQVVISQGITLTSRGSITFTNTSSTGITGLIMKRGSHLVIDPSGRSADTLYTVSTIALSDARTYDFDMSDCTAALPCSVTTTAGGINSMMGSAGYSGGNIIGQHVQFSNLGDAYTPAFTNMSNFYTITDSTFDRCGPVRMLSSITSGAIIKHNRNIHTNSVAGNDASSVLILNGSTANTTGAREVIGNVFDLTLSSSAGNIFGKDFTITGNYFAIFPVFINSSVWASFSGNFARTSPGSFNTAGTSDNSYFWIDASTFNPHFFPNSVATSISTSLFELSHFSGGDSGELFVGSPAALAASVASSILLPDDTGYAIAQFNSTVTSPINTYDFNHDVYWGRYTAMGFGPLQFNESGQSISGSTKMQDNILYSDLGGTTNFYKSEVIADPTNADICNPCSYNAAYNYTATQPSHAGMTNQANGYGGKWSSTPGTQDLDVTNPDDNLGPGGSGRVNPAFADSTRQLATFATAYLGHTDTAGTWSSGTTYNYGDIVAYTVSGIYWGKPVLYRCIVTPTCTAGSTAEPSVGAAWRTNWELASLYYLRQGVAAQTSIVDGAIGCTSVAPCTIITALNAWVRNGFTPQNVKLRAGAHDGTTIGPVSMLRIPSFGMGQ